MEKLAWKVLCNELDREKQRARRIYLTDEERHAKWKEHLANRNRASRERERKLREAKRLEHAQSAQVPVRMERESAMR